MPENNRLPYALYRAEQVRALDRCAIDGFGIPGAELMERAGRAAFVRACARWPDARRMVVLAGAGNNGGDGYVIARLALEQGWAVQLLTLGDHQQLRGEAAAAARAFAIAGGRAEPFRALPQAVDLIVDALLGTGLERPVAGDWAAAIEQINASRAPVLAVDIPSGLHADSGRVLGCAVRADLTVSFIGLKQGMFTARGPDHCGEIQFDALQVPAAIYAGQILAARRLDWRKEQELVPRRRPAAHKGDCGHVLVVGGAPGLSGAPRLAGEAALRTGAGLVTIATHTSHAALLNLTRPELMVHAVADAAALAAIAQRADVIAIGPGLGAGRLVPCAVRAGVDARQAIGGGCRRPQPARRRTPSASELGADAASWRGRASARMLHRRRRARSLRCRQGPAATLRRGCRTQGCGYADPRSWTSAGRTLQRRQSRYGQRRDGRYPDWYHRGPAGATPPAWGSAWADDGSRARTDRHYWRLPACRRG